MSNLHKLVVIFVVCILFPSFVWALEPWTFNKTYETEKITPSGFGLSSVGDLNRNGTKEIIVADFDPSWEFNPTMNGFNLYILEWQKNQLNITYHKKWDRRKKRVTSTKDKPVLDSFVAYKAKQLVTWKINNRILAETMPPYFAVEWDKNKYVIYDEQVWEGPGLENTVGSWALPWITPSCYSGFALTKKQSLFAVHEKQPRECLVGIRDFSGDGHPKIVSVLVDEIIKDKKYKETLRIRDYSRDFPIEWQMDSPNRFGWWALGSQDLVDRLKWQGVDGLLMAGFEPLSWYVFRFNKGENKYELANLHNFKSMDIDAFSLPDIYLGKTENINKQEYWGYRVGTASDKGEVWLLRKIDLAADYTFQKTTDINCEHNEPFLGVVYFQVADIDGDGLDEIILVERTGKRQIGADQTIFTDIAEYVRVLKWDGYSYKSQWASPPFTKTGTKFIVDDIKNTGKKQLVIFSPFGAIQIWDKQ